MTIFLADFGGVPQVPQDLFFFKYDERTLGTRSSSRLSSKMENFVEDVKSLTKILTNLEHCSPSEVTESKFATVDSQHEFSVWFVPPRTFHPLRRIVGKNPEAFLLVGRSFEDKTSQLARYKIQRVPVGTPLSQELFYLTNSEPLQSYTGINKEDSQEKRGVVTEWLLSAENLHPTSLQEARYFLSLYANALRGYLKRVDVWVCVDGNNSQEISYLAAISENQNAKFMRHVIFTSKSEPVTRKEDLPELSLFLRQHHSSSAPTAFVEIQGYALHEIMGSPQSENQECGHSQITVELTWTGVKSLLQPHPHSCDGVLHIKSIPGSVHLSTHTLYLEIKRVDLFSKILENENLPWPEANALNASPVSSQMDDFIAKLSSSNVFSPTVEEELDKDNHDEETNFADATMAHLTFQEFSRKDLDFSERLWLILKDCLDEEDLVASLQICNGALFSGKCQPVFHSSNMTSLAVFARDLLQSETKEDQEKLQNKAKQFLSPDAAIRCLVEIGAEKLARDYTQYFMHEELATMGQLASYVNSDIPLATRVSNIKKLHQTLELVVTAKSVARLSHENLRSLTQSALSYYQSHPDSEKATFSLSLPAFGSTAGAAVKSICATSNPAVWCAAITSKTKTRSHTTIVQLSSNQTCNNFRSDTLDYDDTQLNEEDFDTDKDKFQYYVSCAKQVLMPIIQ